MRLLIERRGAQGDKARVAEPRGVPARVTQHKPVDGRLLQLPEAYRDGASRGGPVARDAEGRWHVDLEVSFYKLNPNGEGDIS